VPVVAAGNPECDAVWYGGRKLEKNTALMQNQKIACVYQS
jgi:hypothetical protein